ncbi:MAG: macro domain-containing protein [Gemmatimonadaceae bacterium]|jgi:O-acetyl-ADP-ribose deacetylase (regulator of RNase III)|nr:macro domain-containing protein [Gemmatimonadota bacterium]MCC7323847.1 macro domain-containing protein [Gemmatimonadaceae bacterium]MBK7833156.1 macro domain-containing protein [Gemmatimonadota bacterium]MBK8057709.1 macro domain-containing protein [Gemmatimonadota bacterium]MBK8646652.1 macro domain-containing protein [Gemmatimonadota bacterium]
MQIAVTIDDLAFVAADAVARPVNAELRAVTPVIRRLEQAAGEGLLRQLHVQQPLEVGAAVVTAAGAVQADLMIHAVVSTETERVTRDGVRRATTSVLQRAHDFAIDRLAIAPFGLGAGNLDVDDAAQTMVAVLKAHADTRPRPANVVIVVENDLEAEAFRNVVTRLWREG